MEPRPDTTARRSVVLACAGAVFLACLMTFPLIAAPGRLGRTTTMDGLYSIWNVAWVARTIVSHPLSLFDANIFYPHRNTLAYSEANLVAGVVAIPAWLLTHNAYAAHSSAVLFAFASTFIGMWLLARRLTGDSASAMIAALLFAFCPYFYSHTAHIQLLMAGGIPLSMLALHRLVDAPAPRRGVELGAALALQALACAYYGIFAGLMVGYAVLFLAAARRLWRVKDFWIAVAIAAATACALVLPFFLHYLELQRSSGFARSLDDARRYAATWQSYLASPAHGHQPILLLARKLGWRMSEVLFPGIIATLAGAAGIAAGARARSGESRTRETIALYGSLGILAVWASFGPAAGLYTVLYRVVPLFTFLRAPSRFGLLIVFVLALFSAIALTAMLRWSGRNAGLLTGVVAALAILELNVVPFPWERALPVSTNYTLLAAMPRGSIAEFPFYGERVAYPLHAQYMVLSTSHWMPLVNGYSDYIPPDFREAAFVLDSFPSSDTFAVLQKHRVRYIGIHWDMYGPRAEGVREKLKDFAPYLRPLGSDETMTLYEIVSFP
jgi:4-amino-4-deoxy-L-arabinose transferase-like glycosyltransferase